MKVLGYHLTWRTRCFIDEGCGRIVIAHTNGYGDFVLFDELGCPWPIHECYKNRRSLITVIRNGTFSISHSRYIDAPHIADRSSCAVIHLMEPDIVKHNHVNIVGEITHVQNNIFHTNGSLHTLTRAQQRQLIEDTGHRNCFVTIVTSDGKEYDALGDSRIYKYESRDIIHAQMQVKSILNIPIFLLSKIRLFKYEGQR